MPAILEIRENIIRLYRQYEYIIRPAYKFLMALLAMVDISGRIGYNESLTGALPTLLVALIASVTPGGVTVAILAVVILAHLYSLSLEVALIGLVLLLLLLLVYFRFGPKDSMLLVSAPAAYMIGIPYALPIAGGLLFQPGSAVTVAVAAIAHSYLSFVSENEAAIVSTGADEDMISRFRFVIDGVLQNKTMLITAAAAAIACILVYIVRRLPVPYAWYIATAAGGVAQLIVILIGDTAYATGISIPGAFLGTIVSVAIGAVITFFLFHLDYSRIENVQFEDDDYYYYVKAVPKINISEAERTVKTINTSRHVGSHFHMGAANVEEPEAPEDTMGDTTADLGPVEDGEGYVSEDTANYEQ